MSLLLGLLLVCAVYELSLGLRTNSNSFLNVGHVVISDCSETILAPEVLLSQ